MIKKFKQDIDKMLDEANSPEHRRQILSANSGEMYQKFNEQLRLLEFMAEGLSQITELKKPDRVREDIKSMEGSFCPSFEVTLEAIYKIALSRAGKALVEYNKVMEGK